MAALVRVKQVEMLYCQYLLHLSMLELLWNRHYHALSVAIVEQHLWRSGLQCAGQHSWGLEWHFSNHDFLFRLLLCCDLTRLLWSVPVDTVTRLLHGFAGPLN